MFDINLLPMNLVNGRNIGDLQGLKVYPAIPKADKSRLNDVIVLLLHSTNTKATVKETETWSSTIRDAYFSARGSLTMGITAASRKLSKVLQKSYTKDDMPHICMNIAIIRGTTLMIGHAGTVNTTIIHSDRVENFTDESSIPINGSTEGLRFFQTKLQSGDLVLLCPIVPSSWTNDAILAAASDTPMNAIKCLLDQAKGNLQAAVIQIKAGRGEISYRYKPPISTTIEPGIHDAYHGNSRRITEDADTLQQARVIKSETSGFLTDMKNNTRRQLFRRISQKDLFIDEMTPCETKLHEPSSEGNTPSSNAETASGVEKNNENVNVLSNDNLSFAEQNKEDKIDFPASSEPPESMESTQSSSEEEQVFQENTSESRSTSSSQESNNSPDDSRKGENFEIDSINNQENTEQIVKQHRVPQRNLKRFFITMLCGILIPIVVVISLFMVYSDRSKNKLHRDHLELAVETAKTALEQTQPQLIDTAWDKVLEYLNAADQYGSSPASQDLRKHALQALDQVDHGIPVVYKYALSSPLPSRTSITSIETSGQYTYMLDQGSGSLLRFTQSGQGMIQDDTFSCTPGAYYTKDYLSSLQSEGKDSRFDGDPTQKVQIGSFVDFVLLPSGNPDSDVAASIDQTGRLLYCSSYSENTAQNLDIQSKGLKQVTALYFANSNLYLLDKSTSSLWVYDYYSATGFQEEPESYFGSNAPNLSDIIDFVVYERNSFFLREDGTLAVCDFTGYKPKCSNVTELSIDDQGTKVDLTMRSVRKILSNSSPDNSLYLMDTELQTVLNISMKLNFIRYIVPDRTNSDHPLRPLEAFGLSGKSMFFWAYGQEIFWGKLN